MCEMVAVLGTFGDEARLARDALVGRADVEIFGLRISTGRIGNLAVVHALTGQGMAEALGVSDLADERFTSDGRIGYELAIHNADRVALAILDWLSRPNLR